MNYDNFQTYSKKALNGFEQLIGRKKTAMVLLVEKVPCTYILTYCCVTNFAMPFPFQCQSRTKKTV